MPQRAALPANNMARQQQQKKEENEITHDVTSNAFNALNSTK